MQAARLTNFAQTTVRCYAECEIERVFRAVEGLIGMSGTTNETPARAHPGRGVFRKRCSTRASMPASSRVVAIERAPATRTIAD